MGDPSSMLAGQVSTTVPMGMAIRQPDVADQRRQCDAQDHRPGSRSSKSWLLTGGSPSVPVGAIMREKEAHRLDGFMGVIDTHLN